MPDNYLGGRVEVATGDITREQTSAIVNAANSSLFGGGGVDGAIHRAGGPAILAACRDIRNTRYPSGLPTGEAVATTAGDLHADYVIHTVGPIWQNGHHKECDLLAACYTNALAVAAELMCTTIAFPAVSTGVYGFPRDLAASVSSQAIETAIDMNETIRLVRLVFYSVDDTAIFKNYQAFSRQRCDR